MHVLCWPLLEASLFVPPAATEDDPISICSYCSDSHAGVRWQVHESTVDNYPYGAFNINIKFHCNNSESDDNMRVRKGHHIYSAYYS